MGLRVPGPDPSEDLHAESRGSSKRFLGWVTEIDWAARLTAALNAPSAAMAATKALPGISRFATDAEAVAGTQDLVGITPTQLAAMVATAAEAVAGTEAKKRITPATLKGVLDLQVARKTTSGLSNTPVKWRRVATLDSNSGTAGGSTVTLLIGGFGDYGLSERSMALVRVAVRDGVKARVTWIDGPPLVDRIFTRSLSATVYEVWIKTDAYQFGQQVTVLDAWNLTGVGMEAEPGAGTVTTAPSGLVTITSLEPDWTYGSGTSAWDTNAPPYFENSVRRVPGGFFVQCGLKRTDGSAWTGGQALMNLGANLRPATGLNGLTATLSGYSNSGGGWSAGSVAIAVNPNGVITTNGPGSNIHGLFGSFFVPGLGS